jgi:7-keto-8-aminopelargonate synthetase-like enzyme
MVTNLASYNFYNFVGNEHVKEKAIQTLRTYGVGPCGPPQFYGTQDVHMKTEADIASCLGTEGCIVYAHAFSTISSVIPAFSKRGDIIVADKAVNYAIRKGLQICRSTIRWYEHNDMEDLERVLQKIVKEQARKPLTRRFIVTEGLFENVGDSAHLAKIVSLMMRWTGLMRVCTKQWMSRLSSDYDINFVSSSMKLGHLVFLVEPVEALRKPKTLMQRRLI